MDLVGNVIKMFEARCEVLDLILYQPSQNIQMDF